MDAVMQHVKGRLKCWQPIEVLVPVLTVALPIQFPVTVPGKAVEGSLNTWALTTHVGDSDGIPGFWRLHRLLTSW